jgi:hypothetical protein
MKQQRWIYEIYVICITQNSREINWSYPPIRSADPDHCPAFLVMSPGRRLAAGLWLWNGSILVYQVPGVLLYLTSRRGKLKEKGRVLHAKGHAAEGQESRMQLTKRQTTERFTRIVSARHATPRPARPGPGRRRRRRVRARVARPCPFLDFSS